MEINRELNCRKVKRVDEIGDLIEVNPEEIKAGMHIRMYEPDGKPVIADGIRLFVATSDARVDDNGVVGFDFKFATQEKEIGFSNED